MWYNVVDEDEESVKIMFYLYFVPGVVNFFVCSYLFSTSMSLEDRFEIDTESKNYFLMYAYNAGPPMPILYTQYYHTV